MAEAMILIVVWIALGTSILAYFRLLKEKVTLLLAGATVGVSAIPTLLYILAFFTPLTPPIIVGVATLLAIVSAALLAAGGWQHWKAATLDRQALVLFILLVALFSLLVPKLLFEQDGALLTSVRNAYGDVTWHAAMITSFAQQRTAPIENPIFAGHALTYPFMGNFLGAVLVIMGASLSQSLVFPALILIPALFTLFYCVIRALGGSKIVAIIALLLVLFGGATAGWFQVGSEFKESERALYQFLLHLPPSDFSGDSNSPQGHHFINPILGLLLPQRTFMFGLALGFTVLLLLASPAEQSKKHFIAAGLLSGLVPFFHAHTVLGLIPAIVALMIAYPTRKWVWYVAGAAAVGIPEVLYYVFTNQEAQSFFRFEPGWTMGERNIVFFWLANTGLLVPAAVVGFFMPAPKYLKALAAAGLVLFVTANLFLFAPWAWDNIKLLIFWLIWSAPLIAYTVVTVASYISWKSVAIAVVSIFIAFHTLSGALDIWKLALPTALSWAVWDADGVAMARDIRELTRPEDRIVTAPYHNSPVVLSGRARYVGYTAHVWSHGSNPWEREQYVKQLYEGKMQTLPEVQVQYALVGPVERSTYKNLRIPSSWKRLAEQGQYTFYSITP